MSRPDLHDPALVSERGAAGDGGALADVQGRLLLPLLLQVLHCTVLYCTVLLPLLIQRLVLRGQVPRAGGQGMGLYSVEIKVAFLLFGAISEDLLIKEF